jgi:hypothetical protein
MSLNNCESYLAGHLAAFKAKFPPAPLEKGELGHKNRQGDKRNISTEKEKIFGQYQRNSN